MEKIFCKNDKCPDRYSCCRLISGSKYKGDKDKKSNLLRDTYSKYGAKSAMALMMAGFR